MPLNEKPNEMVQVILRCRPINEKEQLSGYVSVVKVDPLSKIVEIYNPQKLKMDGYCRIFTFDATYDHSCNNQTIYDKNVQQVIRSVLNGFNSTIFAYGQSGAGKTYTMDGNKNDKGITLRAFEQIFDIISKSSQMQYLVRASYFEIYQDEIRDLLCKSRNTKCELRENKELGVYVKNISSFVCKSLKQMNALINVGRQNRSEGSTDINERSSRSHAVVTITVEMRCMQSESESPVRVGKLNLVDLAGSERQNKTNAEGNRLKEASRINLSLTALGNVISALSENKGQFIPYRDSKLTRLLRNSLGGNSKTLMIANIGPANCNFEETLNTLRYASRARNIKNKPCINEDPFDALLKKYQEEIQRLKTLLAIKNTTKGKEQMNNQPIDKTETNNSVGAKMLNSESNTNKENNSYRSINKHSDEHYMIKLIKRIELMESKLLTGSSNIIEHTFEQQKTLTAHKNEIKEFQQREKDIKEMIDLHKESTEEVRGEFSLLHQEVQSQSEKLGILFKKLKNTQQEIVDTREEFSKDRRELQNTEYELWKDLKLRMLIMKHFIPNKDRRKVLSKLSYDEELDAWNITTDIELYQILPRPKSVNSLRRPVTLYTVITQRKFNHIFRCNKTLINRGPTFRFKAENLLELEQFKPQPTTKDFLHAKISSKLQLKFESAIKEEENIDIDAKHCSFYKKSVKIKYEEVLKSCNSYIDQPIKQKNSEARYPKARGLVCK